MSKGNIHREQARSKRAVRFFEKEEWREGTREDRNGNLSYVRDDDTGRADWYAPHELEERR